MCQQQTPSRKRSTSFVASGAFKIEAMAEEEIRIEINSAVTGELLHSFSMLLS